jgi:hypothetical protein
MKAAPQITLRNIPEPVDRYLRRRAKQTGRSLNQTIIDELSERAGVTEGGRSTSLLESLDWFIGSGMDQDVLDALEEDDKAQKEIAKRELERFQKQPPHDN